MIDVKRALAGLEQQLFHDLAANRRELALEISHPRFARVITNGIEDRRIRYRELVLLDAVLTHLLRNQVPLGDI